MNQQFILCKFVGNHIFPIMRKSLFFTLLFFLFATVYAQQSRETVLIDEDWKFSLGYAGDPVKDFGAGTEYFNYYTKANSIHNTGPYSFKFSDSLWTSVNLPHDWVTTLPYAPEASHSHGYKTVGYKYPETSVGWYRKTLTIGEEDLGKSISLRFDGIFRNAIVWFNGFYMGTEESGYTTQVYDITDYINYGGENLICVRADATFEEGWFYEGAGIYRDVWLVKTGSVHVAPFGTFVYSDLSAPYSSVVLHVDTEVSNDRIESKEAVVSQRVFDADGREVGKIEGIRIALKAKETKKVNQSVALQNPRLWSPDDPYLYTVETTVSVDGKVMDVYKTVTGIRDIAFDADKGFILNGKPLELKGVNMHQDHAGVGAAIPEAVLEWRIRRLQEFGCNAYRSSHNPMTPLLLDICDRLGMLVIDENRLMGINEEHIRLLERMIKRDRNHPSVILWSDGNEEWGLENNEQGIRVAASMREYTRLFDPTRHSTVANAGGKTLVTATDIVGYNYIHQNDVDNRRIEHPEWRVVGTEETTGCGTRGIYFNDPSNRGRMVSINRGGERRRGGNSYENVIERGWKFYAENEWAAGIFYWTGFDYRGEPNPLSYPAVNSEFGILDYCGFWKDEAWYLKSWWTDEPVLHVFPHWNLQGHEGETVDIWAYSNCDEVDLTVNGKRLGRQKMPVNGHLKWSAVYKPGKIVANGYKNGRKILTQTIETTGAPVALRLTADRTVLNADGRDVAIVTIEVLDAKGRVVPDACPGLSFSLAGDASIIGAGNGDPSCHEIDHPTEKDCKSFSFPAFNGLAQILVQSRHTDGSVRLACTADGLSEGELILTME